jgi:hypothetical protein
MHATLPHWLLTALLLALVLSGCGPLTPLPDHWLTSKKSAWGSVEREAPYVLLKDYRTSVPSNGLRLTWFPKMDDVGVLPKGTRIQFTGFNVGRNVCGADPFVYAQVLSGPQKDKIFSGIGLVEIAVDPQKRHARIVRIKDDAIEPLR